MTRWQGIFISEGTSDLPLAQLVENMFLARGEGLDLSVPDFSLLADRVPRTVDGRLAAGLELLDGESVDVVVIHRDTDNTDAASRRNEMEEPFSRIPIGRHLIPLIPIRMTEAWTLLDETAIREVAGNPRGRMPLGLPTIGEIERRANPKQILKDAILAASGSTGRRQAVLARRFDNNRRRLLERINPDGPIRQLTSWRQLEADVDSVVTALAGGN